MKIYFLRHGIAEDRETWKGDDATRPLTPEGRERMSRECKAISKLNLGLDLILTSPLVRAKETAAILAGRLGSEKLLREDQRLAENFDTNALSNILHDHPDNETVMLVGHEPDMSSTIGEVIGEARIDLKKGGLACVEMQDRSSMHGDLLWLIPPKVLIG